METSLFLDRTSPHLPNPGFCLRLIFLGLCSAIGIGLLIPGVILAFNGWKEEKMDSMIPGAIILPTAISCLICAVYLFVRWTKQQIREYHRVRANDDRSMEPGS